MEDNEGYLVICPILPGYHAEGKTYAEAIDNLLCAVASATVDLPPILSPHPAQTPRPLLGNLASAFEAMRFR
ncbi:MAG: hypothetical protein Q7R39_18510 [Dehalococcoidia bacterium]|nr:hypothetical protein [Dehalococcoidia bacterium]